MLRRTTAIAVGFALISWGAVGQAGGNETPENGTVANGRGGAFTARASDATAMMLNVAGIGTGNSTGSRLQIYVGSNLSFYHNCFHRAGTYDGADPRGPFIDRGGDDSTNTPPPPATVFGTSQPGGGDYTGAAYPEVCNERNPGVGPNLFATYAISRRLAVGVGVYGPAGIAHQGYPDRVTVTNPAGARVLAPAPQRYVLLKEDLLILHPTLAVSFEAIPGVLRVGAAIQPSYASFAFETIANVTNNQSPAFDVRTNVSAGGFFLAGNLGFLLTPTPFLQIGGHVHLTTSPDATGTGTAEAYTYAVNAAQRVPTPDILVTSLRIGLAQQFRLGVRAILPRRGGVRINDPNPSRGYDPMRDEVADLEVDGIFETSSGFDSLTMLFDPNHPLRLGGGLTNPLPRLENQNAIDHSWKNIFGVRVGGDYNVLPGVWAVRAGFAYETGAQLARLQNLDAPGFNSASVHLGTTVRISHRFAISLAYAHHFFATVDNTGDVGTTTINEGNAGLRTIGTSGLVTNEMCNNLAQAGPGACTNNRGTYSASLDVLSIGANLAF